MMWERLRRLALLLALVFGAGAVTPPAVEAGQKTTHVKGYTRKDGTVVKPHKRKASRKRSSAAASPPTIARARNRLAADPMEPADPMRVPWAKSDRCENCDRDERGRILRNAGACKAFMNATAARAAGVAMLADDSCESPRYSTPVPNRDRRGVASAVKRNGVPLCLGARCYPDR
jgi:hypothetical protein